MTDAPDLEQLARRYFDLWQDQAAALITDPAVAEAVGRGYALMGKALAAVVAAGPVNPVSEGGGTKSDDANAPASPSSSPAGAAAPAAASVASDLDHAELAARLALLEERILRLEAAFAGGGGGPAPSSRSRRR